ncbi:MAG: hypothetical protein AABX34_05685, partial [Nanoarchaeota archaeon]
CKWNMNENPSFSLFLKAYGNKPKLNVLDFLVTFQEFDYSMKDIAKNAKIGYNTLKLFWKDLVDRKMVVQTRVVGKAKMYKLNKENPEVREFIKLYWLVIDRETERLLSQKKIVA